MHFPQNILVSEIIRWKFTHNHLPQFHLFVSCFLFSEAKGSQSMQLTRIVCVPS